MKTFSEYLLETQDDPRWEHRAQMGDNYLYWKGTMSELEDLIPELTDEQLIGGLYNHQIHLVDIPNPSRAVLEWVIKERPYFLVELHDVHIIPKDLVKQILTSEDFMLNWHETLYPRFVQEYFKDNTIMMNKWLRYGKNVREQFHSR
jgi:hypothetical protein